MKKKNIRYRTKRTGGKGRCMDADGIWFVELARVQAAQRSKKQESGDANPLNSNRTLLTQDSITP